MKIIYGPNASGKSLSLASLKGDVRYLTFRDSYGAADAGYYLQQRWNSSEYEEVPSVRDSFGACRDEGLRAELYEMFGIDADFLDKPVIMLSSGELRKFQLVKALLSAPRMLVLDSPYIGLDAASRAQVAQVLRRVDEAGKVELVLVLSREDELPEQASEIVRMDSCPEPSCTTEQACAMVSALGDVTPVSDVVVALDKVSIRFGARTILESLDWTVHAGEKWAIKGPNGAGKSTLLSIICADIPQAYACDVTLFGRRRGTGESIWDIKRQIGFVSPELHRAYLKAVKVTDVVASGLHDRQGMYVATSPEQLPGCEFWLDVFGVRHLGQRLFTELSSGEQRLVLLARAFVKDPELLILDEPLHGLDDANRARVRAVIDAFCARGGKTLLMVSHYEEDFPTCIRHSLVLRRH